MEKSVTSQDVFDSHTRMFEFYEYPPRFLVDQVHMLFIEQIREAMKATSDKMIELFPDREEDIQKSFTSFSTALRSDINKTMRRFQRYFNRNYCLPKNVPSEEKTKGTMLGRDFKEKINELYEEILTTESFNDMKREEIPQIEEQILIKESAKKEITEMKKQITTLQEMNVLN
ncbi:PREDICTED: uncharacterized protein LOC105314036 [Amphimedon queenslandica]|uniref:Protein MIS12 homolog n=1 Tax=Amphimedon queenslandica TaxID=400682 RepID=A0A1X7U1F0_AMPQE|nr:PREDICTED: uncharacterized protein LOC105314036 [Amphimedon queenslandica]|eukprot:XP_011406244.1 PREDICTED: uncharacterized protein LOC105314036 [Amphimedon queenslandica]